VTKDGVPRQETVVPVPRRQLERTLGRILGRSEQLRVASRVHVIGPAGGLGHGSRGKVILALTDRRLLLVNETVRASKTRLLAEWPADALDINVTTHKLGNCLITITAGDRAISFERVDGHRGTEWATYRFR
jgi:hypothetical protein